MQEKSLCEECFPEFMVCRPERRKMFYRGGAPLRARMYTSCIFKRALPRCLQSQISARNFRGTPAARAPPPPPNSCAPGRCRYVRVHVLQQWLIALPPYSLIHSVISCRTTFIVQCIRMYSVHVSHVYSYSEGMEGWVGYGL